jgi:hypothetical protein
LPVQYADYTLWQRELLGEITDPNSANAEQLRYWTRVLAGLPDEIGLPFDRPRRPDPSYRGELVKFAIGADVHQQLAELARRTGASMFMLFQTGLAILLAKLSGSTDISIGTQVAGRADEQLDDLVGFFVNAVVLRSGLSCVSPTSTPSPIRTSRSSSWSANSIRCASLGAIRCSRCR